MYYAPSKVIVYAWVNDDDTKRAYESNDGASKRAYEGSDDGYRVFRGDAREWAPA